VVYEIALHIKMVGMNNSETKGKAVGQASLLERTKQQ